eukprot:TRINITY_DN1678_c0_g3_i1.p1 TRINITY_DN1678_c0_g3~~TRINITY_DN1678_c0_g3_i1.p1  ORF type:complete len:172 (+),score=12.95 TRINITY_DN1678_c0_g3_i1:29-517(+)
MEAGQIERGKTQLSGFPFYLEEKVVNGYKRGSKDLGIPTANLPIDNFKNILEKFPVGVYYGFANVSGGTVHKMVMSIGWNPYYKNTQKSLEIHIIHQYPEDFYGEILRAVVVGFIRTEFDFVSLDHLIQTIKDDITFAEQHLDQNSQSIRDPFFSRPLPHSA